MSTASTSTTSVKANAKEAARLANLERIQQLEANGPLIEELLLLGCMVFDVYESLRKRLAPLLANSRIGAGHPLFQDAGFNRVLSIIANFWSAMAPVVRASGFRRITSELMIKLVQNEVDARRMLPDTANQILSWLLGKMQNSQLDEDLLRMVLDSQVFGRWLLSNVVQQQQERLNLLRHTNPGPLSAEEWTQSNATIQQARLIATGTALRFEVTSMNDIVNDDGKPPEAIIENILALGGLGTICSRAKGRKSWVALDLCLSASSGHSWAGFKVKKSLAVYVNFELGKKSLRARLKLIARAKGIEPAALEGWLIPISAKTAPLFQQTLAAGSRFAFVELLLDQLADEIERSLKANPEAATASRLVVLDSLYNVHGGTLNENDAADMTVFYSMLRQFAERLGAAVIIIHHFSKGDPASKMAGDRGAGSRVHRQQPDTYVEFVALKPADSYRVEADVRDYPRTEPLAVRWLDYQLVPAPDLDVEDVKRVGGRKKKITDAEMLKHLDGRTLSRMEWYRAILNEFDVGIRTLDRRKDELEADGKIGCNREGKYQKRDCQNGSGNSTPGKGDGVPAK